MLENNLFFCVWKICFTWKNNEGGRDTNIASDFKSRENHPWDVKSGEGIAGRDDQYQEGRDGFPCHGPQLQQYDAVLLGGAVNPE